MRKKMVKQAKRLQQVKAEVVLNAWHNYCRTSWIYRVLEFLRLR